MTEPQMEKENRIKFCLPDDLSKSDRMSPERAAEEEFCIAPVKALPVVGVATEERVSELVLPLDVLVQVVLKLRHDELEPLSRVSSMVREAVTHARKMHFDYNTPVVRSLRRGCASKRPATPNPKHVWNPKKSRLTSDDVAELKAPILRKMRCKHAAASLRCQVTTTLP